MGPRRIVLAALLGLALVVPALAQSQEGDNLLRNPGAEEPPPTVDATGQPLSDPPPPGWTVPDGQFTVGEYGATGFPDAGDAGAIDGGRRFFAGGPAAIPDRSYVFNYASQRVDVSSDAAGIDRGDVRAELSAALGGKDAEGDQGTVEVQFLDAAGGEVGEELTIGPVTTADRGGETKLLPRSASALVPAGTRTIRVLMTAQGGVGDYIDAYFDNVRLALPGATGVQPPTAPGGEPGDGPDTPSAPGDESGGGGRSGGDRVAGVRLSRRPVRLSRSGVIRVRVSCLRRDTRCRGRFSLTAGRHRCGSRRATVPAGRTRRVTIRVTRRCRTLAARRRRGLGVRMTFVLAGERPVTARTVVRPAIRTRARRR